MNYDRLVSQKNKYDPTNLFRHNQNIRPTVWQQQRPPNVQRFRLLPRLLSWLVASRLGGQRLT
jgi:hypothetical protein